MLHRISYVVCGLLGLLLVTPALAAEHADSGLLLSANGGAFNALDNLNGGGTADFKSGYGLGGGLTYLLTEHFGVRGNFTFARSQLQDAAAPILDRTEVSRYFYDADLQYRHPLRSGWTPYLFAGGGSVRIKPAGNDPSESAFSKGVSTSGTATGSTRTSSMHCGAAGSHTASISDAQAHAGRAPASSTPGPARFGSRSGLACKDCRE